MKNYRYLEEIGKVDEAFLKEVFAFNESAETKRRQKMNKTIIMKLTAVAACAALAVGVGALSLSGRQGKITSLPEAQEDSAFTPEISEPADVAESEPADVVEIEPADVVEIEPSYNERIANGETVTVETYIGKRIEHQGFAYTLRDITVSPTFPEGITKADIAATPAVIAYTDSDSEDNMLGFDEKVYDYSEYAAEHGLPPIELEENYGSEYPWQYHSRALDVIDVVDENGLYQGPMDVPDGAYKWIFLEVEIENLSDEEQREYMADMELNGGRWIENPVSLAITPEGEEIRTAHPSFYAYSENICYMSEHTGEELYDGQAEGKKFHNLVFAPRETKTLVLGYCVSDHFVYGDLFLNLHNTEMTYTDSFVYLPLK